MLLNIIGTLTTALLFFSVAKFSSIGLEYMNTLKTSEIILLNILKYCGVTMGFLTVLTDGYLMYKGIR